MIENQHHTTPFHTKNITLICSRKMTKKKNTYWLTTGSVGIVLLSTPSSASCSPSTWASSSH
jgi:hypothetical protein